MVLKESGEMYLETIYVLRKDKGFVRAIDVGADLGYSKPSERVEFNLLWQGTEQTFRKVREHILASRLIIG